MTGVGEHNGSSKVRRSHGTGLVVAVEGLDGSGKTSLMTGLARRLTDEGTSHIVSSRNDTREIYDLQMRLSDAGYLDGNMRCIFGGVELAARYHYSIRPALERGELVLAGKYLLTAFAQSIARGHDREFVTHIYQFAPAPDLTLYLDLSPEDCLARKRLGPGVSFWEAGLDLTLAGTLQQALARFHAEAVPEKVVNESFLFFQRRIAALHEQLMEGQKVVTLDARLDPRDLLDEAMSALATLAPVVDR